MQVGSVRVWARSDGAVASHGLQPGALAREVFLVENTGAAAAMVAVRALALRDDRGTTPGHAPHPHEAVRLAAAERRCVLVTAAGLDSNARYHVDYRHVLTFAVGSQEGTIEGPKLRFRYPRRTSSP